MVTTKAEIDLLVDSIVEAWKIDLLRHSLEMVVKNEKMTTEMKQTVAESLATAIWNATMEDIRKFYK